MLDGRRDDCAGRAVRGGLRRTKRLIEQLLRLARQEAPQKADAASSIDLAEFLRDLISDLMPCADHRDIDLGLSVDINATVRANPHELRSLLHNLLDNALRYTPDDGVVDVRLFADGGKVVVEVVDSGPGIPPDSCRACSTASSASKARRRKAAASASRSPNTPPSATAST